jgi:transaldolase
MKLFLDSADTDAIISRYDTGLISGITTNPTLIKKSGRNPLDVYKKLIDVGIHDISMEVVGENESELFERAIILVKEFADNTTIKLPCSVDGLKACKRLNTLGVRVNVTLIFSPAQAILASLAGASYISPFIGRMDDNSLDGMKLINDISNSLDVPTRAINDTQILAASIRDPQSVSTAFALGADICTVPIDVFDKMYKHVLTDKGIDQFNKDAGL